MCTGGHDDGPGPGRTESAGDDDRAVRQVGGQGWCAAGALGVREEERARPRFPVPAPTRERLTVAASLYRTVTASAEGNVSCPRALTARLGPRAARACPLRPALHPAVGARRQGLGAHGQVEVPTLRILPTPGTGAHHRGWLR